MKNLALFLTKLQTFDLHVITKEELHSPIREDEKKPA